MHAPKTDTNAAEHLEGKVLDSGWTVGARILKAPGATGGFFSVTYHVTKDGEQCFLKAFDFAKFLMLSRAHGHTKPIVDVIGEMVEAYKYERDLSALCRGKRLTKVAFVKEAGEQIVSGFAITVVPYLIFDVADGGDVRSRLSFASALEAGWKLRSLHSVAVGLKQLHTIDVSHQDLKPSNVLVFKDESKIGDLGRSTSPSLASSYLSLAFAGDLTYAPPEILYGFHEPDWRKRSFASDAYLFGSLIVFYFSGLTMTALIRKHIADALSWEQHRGSYDDVQPYVLNAFSAAIDEFATCVPDGFLRSELRALVSALCHPIPAKRAFGPANLAGTALDMERVISRLDYLAKKTPYVV